ncbi:MAG: prepilin peptidase [Candidatus Polarisedimenticolia bacterium]
MIGVDADAFPAAAQAAVAAVLGLIFGSFANVCIHRLPDRRSVAWPGSACPQCGARIAWYDNLPVLSWIVLRGRCRACTASISVRYPLVEALCACLVVALWAEHGLSLRWAALSYLAVSIVVLIPIDMRHGILPDKVTITGIVVGLAASLVTMPPGPFGAARGALVGALVPIGVRSLYMAWAKLRDRRRRLPAAAHADAAAGPPAEAEAPAEPAEDAGPPADPQREGMGLGDVKMLAMVGAFLGAPGALLTMLLGSMLGTIYVAPLLATGRHNMKTPIPFGPFLGVGALAVIFWGDAMIDWYLGLIIP